MATTDDFDLEAYALKNGWAPSTGTNSGSTGSTGVVKPPDFGSGPPIHLSDIWRMVTGQEPSADAAARRDAYWKARLPPSQAPAVNLEEYAAKHGWSPDAAAIAGQPPQDPSPAPAIRSIATWPLTARKGIATPPGVSGSEDSSRAADTGTGETVHVDPMTGTHQAARTQLPLPTNMPPAQTVVKAAPEAKAEAGTKVLVTYVDDGDTFNFDPQGSVVPNAQTHKDSKGRPVFTCRIDAIDAPEVDHVDHGPGRPGQPGGEEARQALKQMIENKQVTVRVSQQPDEHGRNICQVEFQGKGVDREMVKNGLAWVIQDKRLFPDPVRRDDLTQLESDSMSKGRGIFGLQGTVLPHQWRDVMWHDTEK